MTPTRTRPRSGFTIVESVFALAMLAIVVVAVAELTTFAIAERTRADDRIGALTVAENVLESARARPWADLTPEWAASQTLPDDLLTDRPGRKLTVTVAPVDDRLRLKQVTVTIAWNRSASIPVREIRLTALFADRPTEEDES